MKAKNDTLLSADEPIDERRGILKFSNDRQPKILQALRDLHPELGTRIASIYEGILIALNSTNPERLSIVSHLARELSAILPIYVAGLPVRDVRASDEQIRKDLNDLLLMLETGEEPDKKVKEIVEGLLEKIPELVSQKKQLESVIETHPVLAARPGYLNDAFIKQWMELHRYFVRNSHHEGVRNQREEPISDTELATSWNSFESLIYRILVREPFFATLQEVDRLLKITDPKEGDADELMRHIVEPQHRRYFFEKCENSRWLTLLKSRGAFKVPQAPLKKDGYIQFLPWPESHYLAKIAADLPEEVYIIIRDLKTENQTVVNDFLEAALQSPVGIASQYVNLLVKNRWLRGLHNLRLPDKAAVLMQKLAHEGAVTEALILAEVLFSLRSNESPEEVREEDSIMLRPVAKPYFDEWQFGEIVEERTEELATKAPKELFEIYIEKLNAAILIEKRKSETDKFYEYSHIWRPNLRAARSRTEDAKNILLDGVVRLVEKYKDDPAVLRSFAEALNKRTYGLFRRIEMMIYVESPENFQSEAGAILSNKEIIKAYNLRREYWQLLGAAYKHLDQEVQNNILEGIEGGPDFRQGDFTDEQFARLRADWKIKYLEPIKDYLPEDLAKSQEAAIKTYGDPEYDDGELITWDGGGSPISAEELEKLSAEEAFQYFDDYQVQDDPFGRHSAGGLGMIFSGLVGKNAGKYISSSELFFAQKIRPIYFYHFIQGLKDSLRNQKCFDWEPVIQLCHRVVVKKEYLAMPANREEQDWNSVRRVIADFMGDALGRSDCEVPIVLREQVWLIVADLAEDPEPTQADEQRQDSEGGFDAMTLAINTTRGEAVRAAVSYGLWVARSLVDKSVAIKMPSELKELLDKHLDTEHDPSLAIRSVFGVRVPNLAYLNEPWLQENLSKIFSKENQDYLLAAWDGYLGNDVIKEVFLILKEEYRNYIQYLGIEERKGYRVRDLDQRFAQHMAVIYISEPDHNDLSEFYFEHAPAQSRADTINFLGRVVLRQISNLPDRADAVRRIGDLWINRISLPETKIDTEELKEFGWWFKCSPFGRKETLDITIKTLLLIKGDIDVPYEIAEELKSYAAEFPLESITILDLLARAEKETYEHLYKKEEYREVIQLVKASGNQEAVKIADELINYLGSLGLIEEFQDLL